MFLVRLLVNGLAVMIAAYLTPGVMVEGFFTAIIASLVLGFLNTFLKPLFVLFTLPINILTLGLFTLVINTVIVLLVSSLVSGFEVESFFYALLFSVILTLVNWFLSSLA